MSAFVGRTDERRTLEALIARAEEGAVAGLVFGDPGSGKTRLLAETVERAGVENTARIVGYEPERNVPLSASAEFLHVLASSPAGRRLNALVFEPETSGLEPMRIFEAAHRAVDIIEPVLLVVDDLQWIDELSLALCHFLVRAANASGQRLALIAASRPSPQAGAFADSLAQLLPPERFTRLDLGPLSNEESLELVDALVPNLDRAAARAVSEKSGGSPVWLEALGRPSGAELDAAQLVTDRLRGTGADAGTLLALLAVAARPLALADAARLEGWTTERVEHVAAELASRGVAVETAGGIRLAHDVIRDAAFRELAEETRREVQGRLATWLEDVAGNDLRRLREALDHRHAAGLPSLELAARLARSPQRTLLGEEGLRLLTSIADDSDASASDVLELNQEIAGLAAEPANHQVARNGGGARRSRARIRYRGVPRRDDRRRARPPAARSAPRVRRPSAPRLGGGSPERSAPVDHGRRLLARECPRAAGADKRGRGGRVRGRGARRAGRRRGARQTPDFSDRGEDRVPSRRLALSRHASPGGVPDLEHARARRASPVRRPLARARGRNGARARQPLLARRRERVCGEGRVSPVWNGAPARRRGSARTHGPPRRSSGLAGRMASPSEAPAGT